jgi:hypothetical protein
MLSHRTTAVNTFIDYFFRYQNFHFQIKTIPFIKQFNIQVHYLIELICIQLL